MASRTDGQTRLARYLAMAGVGSRRSCDELIRQGRVTINGERVDTPAVSVDPDTDTVCYDGCVVRLPKPVYLVLHKPRGYTCSRRDAHASKLVFELLPETGGRLFTVGRLDRDIVRRPMARQNVLNAALGFAVAVDHRPSGHVTSRRQP